jgi:2-keto-4-pentenoate hydratase/2-oxohepta-3-ene-1,7-dioic acid hydratase in catechol pathway
MKLLFFDDFKFGALKGNDTVVDLTAAVADIPRVHPQDIINGVIEHWDTYKSKLEAAVASGTGVPLSSVRVRPPLPRPANFDCMAVNYMENGTRKQAAPINAFHKSPNAIIGDGETMVLGDIPATIFEGEAEVGIVIGKGGSNIPASEAKAHIFGYVNFIDGSARGMPVANNSFYQVKSRDTFAPIGPFVVTADEIPDPQHIQVRLWNNGVLMQDFNTDDMANNIERCVEFISGIHGLNPGDILATGTNHGGLNPFMDGDKIEMETEGLGRLTITVKDDLKRTWERKRRFDMPGYPDEFTPQTGGKYTK